MAGAFHSPEHDPSSFAGCHPVDYVAPLIDTAKPRVRWVFSVGTTRPCGMVRLSANTDPVGTWNAGYRYGSPSIQCFSHLHSWQLAGIPVMPTISTNRGTGFELYASRFSHDKETVKPGYYAVDLEDSGISVELTSTTRVGFHRYRFPSGARRAVMFDLIQPLGPAAMSDAAIERTGPNELCGYVENDVTSRRNRRVRVYFVARFSVPIQTFQTVRDNTYPGLGAHVELPPGDDPVLLKIAPSFTGTDGALKNLDTELDHWEFDPVVADSHNEWNQSLQRMRVSGGNDEDRVKFYTDLFRVLSAPQTMSDVDGQYCHTSGTQPEILQTPKDNDMSMRHPHISLHDGFWNSQWSTNVVLGLAYTDIYRDVCRFLVDFYLDGGLIPRGPTAGTYSFVMIGAPTTPFLTAAYHKGVRDFDVSLAYEGMKKNSCPGGLMSKAGYEFYTSAGGGIEHYIDRGYIPEGRNAPGAIHVDGAAQTLEYAFQDWALSELAATLGESADTAEYARRARNYRNVFDSRTGFIRPRRKDGSWHEPFDPLSLHDFCEANSWQYSFHVPQDIQDLINLMGGTQHFVQRLDDAFARAEPECFYAPKPALERDRACVNYGNEPGRFHAHLFTHAGAPWLTQKWSRLVKRLTFSAITPLGYCEDDDIGKAAATSLLLSIGLFDIRGGAGRNPVYEITAPVFDHVMIDLHDSCYPGPDFVIETSGGASENCFIQSIKLNGKPLSRLWITHREFAAGGKLEISVGSEPNRSLGTARTTLPPSGIAVP